LCVISSWINCEAPYLEGIFGGRFMVKATKASLQSAPAEHKSYSVRKWRSDWVVAEFDDLDEAIAYLLAQSNTLSLKIKRNGVIIWP
jgi:hypothetical protein